MPSSILGVNALDVYSEWLAGLKPNVVYVCVLTFVKQTTLMVWQAYEDSKVRNVVDDTVDIGAFCDTIDRFTFALKAALIYTRL